MSGLIDTSSHLFTLFQHTTKRSPKSLSYSISSKLSLLNQMTYGKTIFDCIGPRSIGYFFIENRAATHVASVGVESLRLSLDNIEANSVHPPRNHRWR